MLKYFFIVFTLISFPHYAVASISIETMQQQLDVFKNSSDAIYAKTTLTRAEAYLGAAMLANDENQQEATQQALQKAQKTLQEAKSNAQLFQTKFAKLLSLQASTQEAVNHIPHDNNPLKDPNPVLLLQDANQTLGKVIDAVEAGKLNSSQQEATLARKKFTLAFDTSLPMLIELTSSALSHAASKKAKYYAPLSYAKAKQAFANLKLYYDGLTHELPEHPAQGLKLAELTIEICNNVKAWRKNKASHELLWLEAREQRQKLAKALHIPLQRDDISVNTLLESIKALQVSLQQNKIKNKENIAKLQSKHNKELTTALENQQRTLSKTCEEQMQSMKDIFRVKLERETFEIKRQKRIQALFPKHEVSIIANLDGSLVLRLSSLKFSPGSSKIDAAYFDLLSRVKNVLDIYGDRNFRLEGHTDDQGDLKANQRLSLRRAEAVRDFLSAAGADASAMKALGYGEVRPIASNDFAKGREMNRRIDLIIEARNEQ